MAYGDLAAQLTGMLPGLSPFLASQFINNAWRKVRDRRQWAFLIYDSAIVCPPQITTGTANITRFSTTVTLDAVASAAVALVNVGPGAGALSLVKLQIRFMTVPTTSEIYNILAVDTTNPNAWVLTLDRGVQEATTTTSPILIYRVYIQPPDPTFSEWVSLSDMVNGYQITRERLRYTSAYFDVRDPQRQSLGMSYYLGLYRRSPVAADNGIPWYELWPGCTQGQTFYCRYRSRGTDFAAPTDVQPAVIPDDLILNIALIDGAYPHCQANIGHFPAMAKVNWSALIAEKRVQVYGNHAAGVRGSMRDAIINDDNEATQSVLNRGHGLRPDRRAGYYGPIDANYFQSHGGWW